WTDLTPLTRKRHVEQRANPGKGGSGPSSSPPSKSKHLSLSKKCSHWWEFLDECAEGALAKKSCYLYTVLTKIPHQLLTPATSP
ncbi:hypothetical protein GBAR_LOCUS6366, partial [Geodia barretti]